MKKNYLKKYIMAAVFFVGMSIFATGCDNGYEELRIEDFFVFEENTLRVTEFENEDLRNEEFNIFLSDNRVQQLVTLSQGDDILNETTLVLEKYDGALRVVSWEFGHVFEDITGAEPLEPTIVLQEPLVVGTTWEQGGFAGGVSEITSVGETVETPLGTFENVIEVTTRLPNDGFSVQHFAVGYGMIQDSYFVVQEDITIGEIEWQGRERTASTYLSEVRRNTANRVSSHVFVPGATPIPIEVAVYTNTDFVELFSDLLVRSSILSNSVTLNSVELDRAKSLVIADFSANFLDYVGGSSEEMALLESLANTFGKFYRIHNFSITLDGENYESGHFQFDEDTFVHANWEAHLAEIDEECDAVDPQGRPI